MFTFVLDFVDLSESRWNDGMKHLDFGSRTFSFSKVWIEADFKNYRRDLFIYLFFWCECLEFDTIFQ